MAVAKHSLSYIPSLERDPGIPPALPCFHSPPSHPLLPLDCRVAGSASLSNLHHWPEKHWVRCWHAGLTPHRGWQIISQPLCAERGQPGSRILNCTDGHEAICLDRLCCNDAGNVGTRRSCCAVAGVAGQGWTSCGVTLFRLHQTIHTEKRLHVIAAEHVHVVTVFLFCF